MTYSFSEMTLRFKMSDIYPVLALVLKLKRYATYKQPIFTLFLYYSPHCHLLILCITYLVISDQNGCLGSKGSKYSCQLHSNVACAHNHHTP